MLPVDAVRPVGLTNTEHAGGVALRNAESLALGLGIGGEVDDGRDEREGELLGGALVP